MSRFYKASNYNGITKEQMWMSAVNDFHDSFCRCWHGFAHMLDLIFPDGHKDRDLTIRQIIERDLQCHSGGDGEENLGWADGDKGDTKQDKPEDAAAGEDIEDKDLAELLIAAEDATTR